MYVYMYVVMVYNNRTFTTSFVFTITYCCFGGDLHTNVVTQTNLGGFEPLPTTHKGGAHS